MIIYGTNGSHVRTEPLPGASCPACRTANEMQVSVFSRYVHIYWVPLLPYGKPAVAQCQRCQADWELKQLPPEAEALKQAVRARKKATRAPWWQWSGAAVLALAGIWTADAAIRDGHDNEAFLAAPQVGDIYTLRDDSTHNYTLLKVVQAQANTVEVVANEYETDNAQPIQKLNKPDYFGKETVTLTHLDLLSMKNKGQLTDVDRLSD
ncbi:hypothetical protein LJ737_17455 [Hymenobacter sp. 15J16-1T3B]|uniref:hypothetical protein n=1 Tax=Hymenobacter sp. 15J16-1T3B TaxID=2886941 RepID=UPI001D0F5905|nr:hypothetical protein [Hymenobacter sp. 15J16-1T3B]MCC3159034.1 hypothetical protein [Hymenobacter sp. 15J16-1T3B]